MRGILLLLLIAVCLGSTGCATTAILAHAPGFPPQRVEFTRLDSLGIRQDGSFDACITVQGLGPGQPDTRVLYHLLAQPRGEHLLLLVPDPATAPRPCHFSDWSTQPFFNGMSDPHLLGAVRDEVPLALGPAEREQGCPDGDVDALLRDLYPGRHSSWQLFRSGMHVHVKVCGHRLEGLVLRSTPTHRQPALVVVDESGPHEYGNKSKPWLYPLLPVGVAADAAMGAIILVLALLGGA